MALGINTDDGFQAGSIQVDESEKALAPPFHIASLLGLPHSPAPEEAASAHINSDGPSPSVTGMSSAARSGAADGNVASLSTGESFSHCIFAVKEAINVSLRA